MQEKLFYKIGEVSEMTGLESYVLRFWETEFSRLRPRKSKGNQRVYTRKEIDLILRIKGLLYKEGLTISGARRRLVRPSRAEGLSVPNGKMGKVNHAIHTVKRELEELLHILR
ncbi:MAG: MerR family transcriptional regulator [Nitrospira sp.]|nr:MerR family transcriptional regulator [Candidatus Manganitrophaceae bacterium]HIL35005.1 MerR family transcriptional regulator [Candidatus Manganitrophaceae bacterium]